KVLAYEAFMKISRGGFTLSGGEPLVQADFCMNVIRRVRARGVHVALDTNGFLGSRLSDADLEQIDLVMLDLKSWDDKTHLRVTGLWQMFAEPTPTSSWTRCSRSISSGASSVTSSGSRTRWKASSRRTARRSLWRGRCSAVRACSVRIESAPSRRGMPSR